MEPAPSRGSQSEEEINTKKSNHFVSQDTSGSLDKSNLKIILPSEGSGVAKAYIDRPTPR
jgi:hypothetical protein